MPVGDNEYGGFACLRPFIEDLDERERLLKAAKYLRKAETLDPHQAHNYYLLGKIHCLLGDYENAIPAFQRFGELRPRNPAGYLEMGFALLQACPPNGKCENGLNTYDTWRRAGVQAEDLISQGWREYQVGNYEAAYIWFQNARRMGVDLSSTLYYIKYLDLNIKGMVPEAVRSLQKAVENDRGWLSEEQRVYTMFTYAHTMLMKEKFKDSEKYYLKILKETEGHEEYANLRNTIYFHLGSLYAWTGQSDKAEPLLRHSIEIEPLNSWAYLNLGISKYWEDSTQIDVAKNYFDQAIRVSQDDQSIWQAVIQFWIDRNLVAEKQEYCLRALAKNLNLANCP